MLSSVRIVGTRAARVRGVVLVAALGGLLPWGARLLADDGGKTGVKRALQAGDVEQLDQALATLSQGGASEMRFVLDVLEKMPASQDSFYWSLVGAAAGFKSRPAMDELGKFVVARKSQPIARDLLYGLAKSSSPYVVKPFRPLLFDAPEDVRLLVAKKISKVRSHDAVDALLELLKVEEKDRREKLSPLGWIAVEGLTAITKQNFGPNSINWEGWWKKNEKSPLPTGAEEDSRASGTAVDFLKMGPDRERREAFIGVEKAPLKSVVVLDGEFTKKRKANYNNDRMQGVLSDMGVPHEVVRREDFKSFDLKDTGVLLINCTQFYEHCICPDCKPGGGVNNRLRQCTGCNKHIQFSAMLSGEDVKKIATFVQNGGYLFCEDWTVKEVVERAFPKYVAAGPKLAADTVDVVPVRGQSTHPYLRGIFEPKFVEGPPPGVEAAVAAADDEKEHEGTTIVVKPPAAAEGQVGDESPGPIQVKHQWKIDNESFSIKILDKARVTTFLTSGKLQKEGEGAVAVAFRPGSSVPIGQKGAPRGTPGVVTVVLSHFGKQASFDDELSIQNLLLNVLIDANSARAERSSGGRGAAEKKGAEKKAPEPAAGGASK